VLLSTIALGLAFSLAANALPPPKGGAKGGEVAALETEAAELSKQVDREIMRLFSDQIWAGVYRARLSILQKEWQGLFAASAPKPVARTYPPVAPLEFAVNEALASDADTLDAALGTPSCKKRAGCKIWARISFGKELVRKGGKFEFSADLKTGTGLSIKRHAVPAKELAITGAVMTVDLPISDLYIYKGTYQGTLKVLCNERYKSKSFTLELISTY
jgi:hypothetical protein